MPFKMSEVFINVTGKGPQPKLVSFVNFALAVTTVINCCSMLSALQPNGLVVFNLIIIESRGFCMI